MLVQLTSTTDLTPLSNLVESILTHRLLEANEILEDRFDEILEQKLYERMRAIDLTELVEPTGKTKGDEFPHLKKSKDPAERKEAGLPTYKGQNTTKDWARFRKEHPSMGFYDTPRGKTEPPENEKKAGDALSLTKYGIALRKLAGFEKATKVLGDPDEPPSPTVQDKQKALRTIRRASKPAAKKVRFTKTTKRAKPKAKAHKIPKMKSAKTIKENLLEVTQYSHKAQASFATKRQREEEKRERERKRVAALARQAARRTVGKQTTSNGQTATGNGPFTPAAQAAYDRYNNNTLTKPAILARRLARKIHKKGSNALEFARNSSDPNQHPLIAATLKSIAGGLSFRDQIGESITSKTPVGDVIHDFVHSKNKVFKGHSKKLRIKQALAAWYSKHRKEEVEIEEKYDGPMTKFAGGRSKLKEPAVARVRGVPMAKQSFSGKVPGPWMSPKAHGKYLKMDNKQGKEAHKRAVSNFNASMEKFAKEVRAKKEAGAYEPNLKDPKVKKAAMWKMGKHLGEETKLTEVSRERLANYITRAGKIPSYSREAPMSYYKTERFGHMALSKLDKRDPYTRVKGTYPNDNKKNKNNK